MFDEGFVIQYNTWYPFFIFLAFFLFVLICVVNGIIRMTKRLWQSTNLSLLTVSLLFFATFSLISLIPHVASREIGLVAVLGILLLPPLLNLHIKNQLSHREVNPLYAVVVFLPAFALSVVIIFDIIFPDLFLISPIYSTLYFRLVFYIYALILSLGAFLHCSNVLHQMPQHMRSQAKYILAGVVSFCVLLLNIFNSGLFPEIVPHGPQTPLFFLVGTPVTLTLVLHTFYTAQSNSPSEDVIVTSRELVMGGLNTTVLVLNSEMKILDWNKNAWNNEFPLPLPEFMESMEDYRKRLKKLEDGRVSPHNDDIIIAMRNGREVHFLLKTHPINTDKRSLGYIAEITEVTSIYKSLRYFEEIAHIDTLTGLYNRNAYFDHVQRVTKKEYLPLLIFVGDVNYLKTVNDSYGHMHGDELLKTIGHIIKKAAPDNAFVARTGGDEFVVLVPRGNVYMARIFMQKIIKQCEEVNHEIFGSPSISWGYSIMATELDTYNKAFERADAMMYEYKRNRHGFRSSSLLPEKIEGV